MTLMIVGFAVVLAMAVALVVDASAAYLHRQGLDAAGVVVDQVARPAHQVRPGAPGAERSAQQVGGGAP